MIDWIIFVIRNNRLIQHQGLQITKAHLYDPMIGSYHLLRIEWLERGNRRKIMRDWRRTFFIAKHNFVKYTNK